MGRKRTQTKRDQGPPGEAWADSAIALKEPDGGWDDGHVEDELGDAQGFVRVEHAGRLDKWTRSI